MPLGGFKGMINAVLFDLYGTLIDIRTEERDPAVYWHLSRYLSYHGVKVSPERLQEAYFEILQRQLNTSREEFPEVNVYEIFSSIMHTYGRGIYKEQVIVDVCMLFRSLTIRHFALFSDVIETLSYLQPRYMLALVSDAQWVFTEPEIAMLNLEQFFGVRVLSSRYGYKKPDTRLFKKALKRLNVRPEEAVYIGDNPQRDLMGAKATGMACILFRNETRRHNGYEADALLQGYADLKYILRDL
jgi:putative hydrolase of the HAD superfamily